MRVLIALVALFALAGCGSDAKSGTAGPQVGAIYCKSPITGLPVAAPLAMAQARQLQATPASPVYNTTVNVDCGDDIVVVPPVIIPGGV
jgi:hypothetical protein